MTDSPWQEWEEVCDDNDSDTCRMRVFGGYLYRERIYDGVKWIAVAICFVPAFPAED